MWQAKRRAAGSGKHSYQFEVDGDTDNVSQI